MSHSSRPAESRPSVAVITCAVLEMEIRHITASLDHVVAVKILEQGLHNEPARLRSTLQAAIDELEDVSNASHIALGYGLCSRGVEGVSARQATIVLTRAHDCITLLLGSRERYDAYVAVHPGAYWYSPGWNQHHVPPGEERYVKLRQEYAEKYGEDNADFLMEQEQSWFSSYDRATYVDIGVSDVESDLEYTRACARWLGWQFDRQHGDPQLLIELVCGPWPEDRFLLIPPGKTARMTADERVVEAIDSARYRDEFDSA